MTNSSTRTPFIIAAVLVGSVTYFIVFNLDALVSFGWTTYSGFRQRCIEQMAEDGTHSKWQKRARDYSRFEPDRGRIKPSEWYILVYCLLHPFRRSLERKETENEGERCSSSRPSYRWSSYMVPSTGAVKTSPGKAQRSWLLGRFKKSEKSEEKNEPNTA
jgi:hypothetical protein